MDEIDFYQELEALDRFEQVASPENYTDIPESWEIFVTDVRGSTRAIEAGRYKDVNVLGATGIVAALNAVGKTRIPYVFGGDGASMLVPGTLASQVEVALAGVRRMADEAFDMELRVGRVPVPRVLSEGPRVCVAKYRVSPTVDLAMFTGGGLACAEDLIKGSDKFEVPTPDPLPEPNLEGLQCRWKPIENSQGTMLSLMVVARGEDEDERANIYRELLEFIDASIDFEKRSPAHSGMEFADDLGSFDAEARAHTGRASGLKKTAYQAKARAKTGIFSAVDQRGFTIGDLDPQEYKREVVSNTDFRKFDDCLRMVIDIDHDAAAALRSEFERRHKNGELCFGIHPSNTALMTCLVFNMHEDHVHFVDGNDGGYAMAARELKAQLKALSSE